MLWADEAGRSRRPIVAIEDHLYHTGELLDAIATADRDALGSVTVCVLDRPGPDTSAAVAQWAERYPDVAIVTLADLAVDSLGSFARDVARYVRPGGIVLQDIQLTTLPFVPADRWWESIYLGATIRGLFAERAPVVRFCSNKRGYDATFGKDLIDAGFDPREVMDKGALAEAVVPGLLRLWRAQFPRRARVSGDRGAVDMPVHDADRTDVERACDLVLWRSATGATLGGRRLAAPVTLKAGAPEIETWRDLLEARFALRDGIGVLELGQRLAEPEAGRAEQTNLAARHMHGLRSRLSDETTIATANHRYRIDDRVSVALV
jgi:hypothetical protein